MGSLGPTHLVSLLLAVAIVSATCGFVGSAVSRRNKRRARGFFFLGFFCGFVAGPVLRISRRSLNALRAVVHGGPGHFAVDALTIAVSQAAVARRSISARLYRLS